ncbi:MAG: iron ABC transporter permease [Alphaproteobacteria bacterium]|nr:iron ABC transporter permease [Alphaproteobacteria bacterium]
MVDLVFELEAGVAGAARRRWYGTGALLSIAIAAALFVLVGYPLAWLALKALQSPSGAGLTVQNFVTVFTTLRYLTPVRNSLEVAAAVGCLDLVIAVPMAWAVVRTDMPAKGVVRGCVIGAFITPGFLGAIAWTLLAGPNAGWLNKLWMDLTGAGSGLFNIYSLPGIVFVISLYTFPFVFLLTATALELMSSEMENAAAILGASVWQTLRMVTIPLVRPALLAGFIIAFLEAIADLGTPLLLAVPARLQVITTQLFQFYEFPSQVEVAAAYSLPLLMITGALLYVQRRLLLRKGYSTFTGKGGAQRLIRLGRWRYVPLAWCLFVVTLSLFLPSLTLLSAATSKGWARGWGWENFTLGNFHFILVEHPAAPSAITHSFVFAAAAAFVAVLVAFLTAYIVNRRLVRGGWILGYAAMTPFVIPGIVMAMGFLAAYTRPPLALYGTAWILILAYASRFLPIAYSTGDSALKSIDPDLEDAARITGAGRFATLREVTLPLVRRGIFGGWVLVMIAAIRELSTAIFLFSANTKVMSTVLIDFSEAGEFERLSALGIIMLALTLALTMVGHRIVGRRFLACAE